MSHCLFWVLRPTREFFTHMDVTITSKGPQILTNTRHSAIEQRGIFSVPHLLWHGASIYNGHFWGSVTRTPVLVVWHWSFPFLGLRLRSVATGIRTHNLLHVRWAIVKILGNNKLKNHKKFQFICIFFHYGLKCFEELQCMYVLLIKRGKKKKTDPGIINGLVLCYRISISNWTLITLNLNDPYV